MTIETSKIIIDDDLTLDVNTGVIGSSDKEIVRTNQSFPMDEIMSQLDKLDDAVRDLESSFDSYSTSRLSKPGREGVYYRAGLITNIIFGIMLALIIIVLLM